VTRKYLKLDRPERQKRGKGKLLISEGERGGEKDSPGRVLLISARRRCSSGRRKSVKGRHPAGNNGGSYKSKRKEDLIASEPKTPEMQGQPRERAE